MNADSWNKPYININRLVKIFPFLKNNNNYHNLKIDEESLKYITVKETAEEISKIICSHLIEIGINPLKIKLVDYTAGVGGNILSFCNYFYEVLEIELSNIRTIYLKNNVEVYNYNNIKILNKSSIDYNNTDVVEYSPNVIFMDVPWGILWQKTIVNYRINFGEMELETFILNVFDKFYSMHDDNIKYNNYNNRILVLKLPKNYDIEYFYNSTIKIYKNNLYNIVSYIYILQKMLLIVIEYKFI